MKRLLIMGAMLFPGVLCAQHKGFDIKGSFSQLLSGKVFLIYNVGDVRVADSAELKDGHFEFKGKVSEPTEMTLRRWFPGAGNDAKTIFIENDQVLIHGVDSIRTSTATGSKLNQEYEVYFSSTFGRFRKVADSIQKAGLPDAVRQMKLSDARNGLHAAQKDYVYQHPASYTSLLALELYLFNVADSSLAGLQQMYAGMNKNIKSTRLGKELGEKIKNRVAIRIGAEAPVFTENDVNGHPVSLTDLRGKYVFIDFWASWCKPCRAENPNLVALYQRFRDQNFTILGVSLDAEAAKEQWLAAIKKDGIEWTQVSDLNSWNNKAAKLYNISSIPQNFLIDPQGRIIDKNLHGEELERRLAELFH